MKITDTPSSEGHGQRKPGATSPHLAHCPKVCLVASLVALLSCALEIGVPPVAVAVVGSDVEAEIETQVSLVGSGSYVAGQAPLRPDSAAWSLAVSPRGAGGEPATAAIADPEAWVTTLHVSSPGLYVVRLDVSHEGRLGRPAYVNIRAYEPDKGSPSTTEIVATPESLTADGVSTAEITVRVNDFRGNPIERGGDTVLLFTTSGRLSEVIDRGDGSYVSTLTATTIAGSATITGELNGQSIRDHATVELLPGPASPSSSTLSASPTAIIADGVSTSTLTLSAMDQYGNPLSRRTVDFSTDTGTIADPTDHGDGRYTAVFTSPERAGQAIVKGMINGVQLEASVTLELLVGPACAAASSISASPSSILADGISTSQIAVAVADANQNPRTGGDDTVSLESTEGTLGDITYEGNGRYLALLTSALGETRLATVSATVNGDRLAQPTTVRFIGIGDVKQVAIGAHGNVATASFDEPPRPGSLLVAVSFHRVGWTDPHISDDDWELVTRVVANRSNSSQRRGMAIWYKTAGHQETATVSTWWTGGSSSDADRSNDLIVHEFRGSYALDVYASADSGPTQVEEQSTGTTAESGFANSFVFGAMGMREGGSLAEWTEELFPRVYHRSQSGYAATIQTAHRTALETRTWESTASWQGAGHAVASILVFSRMAGAIEVVGGADQTKAPGETLDSRLAVRILDPQGYPIERHPVLFQIITAPEGARDQSLSATYVETNAAGEASTELTLGDKPGVYTVVARTHSHANGDELQITFTATAEAP